MCWGFRFSIPLNAKASGIQAARAYHQRASSSGRSIPYLERRNGTPEWKVDRYGLMLKLGRNGRLFWNAKREALKTNEHWARLMRQRVAIPVDAYVESSPCRTWHAGERAWIPGLVDLDHDGGIVTITEPSSSGGQPILLTQAAAMAWLDAHPWDAVETLSGDRIPFTKSDIFLSAALDREMSSKAALAA